jgi:hypothetical protein
MIGSIPRMKDGFEVSDLTAIERTAILGGNAARLLGLE